MSRQVDPEDLSADDVEYIRVRPMLRQEFIMQGYGDPLDPEYPGLNFDAEGEEEEDEDLDPDSEDEESEEEEEEENEDPDPEEDSEDGYDEADYEDLKALVKARGLKPDSKKSEDLIAALRADDEQAKSEADNEE